MSPRWILARLRVLALLLVVFHEGTRPVDREAQAIIGGAARYCSAQPSSYDRALQELKLQGEAGAAV